MVYDLLVSGGRILLVDDEARLVQLMGRYLERVGYETASARSAAEAWAIVEQGPAFAVAIVDRTLGGPDGEALARRVLRAYPEIKVILISGYVADLGELEREFPGRVSFLPKPFSGEMLAEAVRRVGG